MTTRQISAAVGVNGVNLEQDTRVIQVLLNAALESKPAFKASGIARLSEDGKCGPKTKEAITTYQRVVLGWSEQGADGTVSPNRTTWRSLNGNASGPITPSNPPSNESKRPGARPMFGGYVAFRQGDYGKVSLGSGSLNISGHGCALCTLTMAATVHGSPNKHWPKSLRPADLDPPAANAIIKAAGGFSGSSLFMAKAASALGMTYDEYGRTKTLVPADVGLIEAHLNAGFPVAGHVDYKSSAVGDHWVLIIKRYIGGTFDAIDPATGKLLNLTKHGTSTGPKAHQPNPQAVAGGVLFGTGMGGSSNQQKYVVVRFGLLAPAGGGWSSL